MELSERVELLEKDAEHFRVEAYVLRSLVAALIGKQGNLKPDEVEAQVQEALDRLKAGAGQAHSEAALDETKAKAVAEAVAQRAKEVAGG